MANRLTYVEEIEWVIENLETEEEMVLAYAKANEINPAILGMWRYYRPRLVPDSKGMPKREVPDQSKLWDLYNRLCTRRFEKYEADRVSRERDLTDEQCVKIARRFLDKCYGSDAVEPVYRDHGAKLGKEMLRDCAQILEGERRVPPESPSGVRQEPAPPKTDDQVVSP